MKSHEFEKRMARLRRPAWQLSSVSTGSDSFDLTPKTIDALTRILDLLPGVSGLTIRTEDEATEVSRDFSGNYIAEVDQMLADIFERQPEIKEIIFPGKGGREHHIATQSNPTCLPD
ncbi:hypothetical protein ACRQ1B_28455 [Rhizobium panacihumi]|uniref:hypothetical protein n=1 Tax=Rhizobium panacihumi TaxID=2008450 RepID=UPI003D78E05A